MWFFPLKLKYWLKDTAILQLNNVSYLSNPLLIIYEFL